MPSTGTIDVTTLGARSGERRWFETWYVVVDELFLLTGTPGRRDWLANLVADPRATVALRDPARTVETSAQVITDPARRRELVPLIWDVQPWYAQQPFTQPEWVSGAPVAVLTPR